MNTWQISDDDDRQELQAAYRRKRRLEMAEIADEFDGDIPEDTDTVENCDDWGTGEGRYHGRM